MEPQLDKSTAPGLALPRPAAEQGGAGVSPFAAGPETGVVGQESYTQPSAPAFVAPGAAVPTPAAALPPVSPQQVAAPVVAVPLVATSDNAEELDRELINKAKAIVEQTKTDPFLESRELGKAKAEYLRMRYNKHVKVAEEQAG